MIKVLIGDIFESKADVLVNTVNCVGVMGKGIAKIFKEKYPTMFLKYLDECNNGLIKPGHIYPYYENNKLKIINFTTKDHWRNSSKIEYISDGLDEFIDNYKSLGIKSIAFPPLGCGNGGLKWEGIGPLIYNKLIHLDDIDIEIYAPYGTRKELISIDFLKNLNAVNILNNKLKMNKNWLLSLHMINLLKESKYNVVVGRTIFQKIFYVLSVFGINMDVEFSKGTYGPFSPKISEILAYLANNNLIIEKEYGKMFRIIPTDKYNFDENIYSKKELEAFNKALNLFELIKNTSEAEIVTTIIYSAKDLKKRNIKADINNLIKYVCEWKNKYDSEEIIEYIKEIIYYLSYEKIIDVVM